MGLLVPARHTFELVGFPTTCGEPVLAVYTTGAHTPFVLTSAATFGCGLDAYIGSPLRALARGQSVCSLSSFPNWGRDPGERRMDSREGQMS